MPIISDIEKRKGNTFFSRYRKATLKERIFDVGVKEWTGY